MLRWLKCKLREWLVQDEPVSHLIAFRVPTNEGVETMTFSAQAVMGTYLVCTSVGRNPRVSSGVRMLGAYSAVDQQHFWKLWKQLAGDTEFRWESGEKFEPWKT